MNNIIVAFPKPDDAKNIRNALMRGGFHVAAVCISGAQVLQVADNLGEGIVVCGYKLSDMMFDNLKECLPKGVEMILIASERNLSACYDRSIITLALPLKVHNLMDTVELVQAARLRKQKKLRGKPKARSPREQQMIQDAKSLLMERNNMTEEEAHRYMQKCSMDSGTNMVETAEMIFALLRT